ncbi:MAG: tetratricopeptide repeat protein, partial [Ignavibacteria bacterium]
FAYWTVSGMETALFAMLTTLGIYFYLKETHSGKNVFPYSSFIFLLASLSRPEGNLIFAITVLHRIIIILKVDEAKQNELSKIKLLFSKSNVVWLALYIIPAIIFMVWRYSYYGYLFPNTFYAKTGSSLEYIKTGLDYFVDFAKIYGLYGILILFIFINLKKDERFFDRLYLVMLFSLFSLYIIYIGGDVLRPARFFVPILPVFYLLIQEGVVILITSTQKKQVTQNIVLVSAVVILALSYFTYKQPYDDIKRDSTMENGLVDKMKITASWLKSKQAAANRPLVVAATTIGAVSYFSDVTLIDMLGLTDKEIAHHPTPIPEISSNTEIGWKERHYNVDYVLSRKPDYIYFSTGIKPSAYAERGLFTNEDFLKYYYPSYFTIREQQFTDCIYKRKTEEEVKEEKTLPPNPNYQKSFVNLFNQALNTMRDKSKTAEALDLFKKTLEIAPPNFGTPYEIMGDLYMQGKNREKGVENYKKAIEANDYNIMAHYGLFQIYQGQKDTANANKEIDKIMKYSPDMLK